MTVLFKVPSFLKAFQKSRDIEARRPETSSETGDNCSSKLSAGESIQKSFDVAKNVVIDVGKIIKSIFGVIVSILVFALDSSPQNYSCKTKNCR